MSYARGRFGVEYNPERRGGGGHLFRWIFVAIVAAALISLVATRGCRRGESVVEPIPPPAQPAPPAPRPAAPVKKEAPPEETRPAKVEQLPARPAPPPATVATNNWTETAKTRPSAEAALLARLADAERLGNKRIARDTLEKLRRSSAMADLDDPFARRLGALNAEMLFSPPRGEPDGWTVPVVVKRGDSAQRIAREHGTTLAAVLKLNSLKDANRIRTGDTLRILEFPRATLVVHAGLKFADITLNGRFFRRYDASFAAQPSAGAYPITRDEGPTSRFTALGLKFSPADREELALLLAPGSRIIVSPM